MCAFVGSSYADSAELGYTTIRNSSNSLSMICVIFLKFNLATQSSFWVLGEAVQAGKIHALNMFREAAGLEALKPGLVSAVSGQCGATASPDYERPLAQKFGYYALHHSAVASCLCFLIISFATPHVVNFHFSCLFFISIRRIGSIHG
jgi:hypothetical protein